MAIDTAEKRRSISGLPFLVPGVTPNATHDQEWRQESGWSYSGILAADIAVVPTPTTGNKLLVLAYNLITDPNVELSASSETAGFEVANLRDERLSRKWKATGKASEWVKLNCTNVVASLKQATHFAITTTNLTINAVIRVQTDTTDDFSSPVDNQLKALVLDPDTDPDTWGETAIFDTPYKTHLFALGSNLLASNSWIRVLIEDPDNPNPIRIAKMFIGWGVQWNVNYNLSWQQSFDSHSTPIKSSAGGFFSVSRATFDRIALGWSLSPSSDHIKARYIAREFGSQQPMWIALEPEHTSIAYARDGMRVHAMTYYGHGRIAQFVEPFLGTLSYGLQFEEAVTAPFSDTLGGQIGEDVVVPSLPYVAVVNMAADVPVPTGTDHQVIPDTVAYDPHSMYDSGTGRFTIKKDDYYNVWFAQAMEDSASATDRKAWILEGGSTVIARETKRNTAIAPALQTRSVVLNPESGPRFLTAGSYIEFYLRHNHGSDVAIGGLALGGTYGIERVGPTSSKQCKARRTTAFNVATNNLTPVPLLTEDFDPDSMHVANDSKITIVDAGTRIWEAIGSVFFDTHADSYREANILRNGAEQGIEDGGEAVNSGGTGKAVKGTLVNVVAGNYFEICGRQYSGGNLDILTAELYLREIAHTDESFIGCWARTATSQNIAKGSSVVLALELEGYDTDGFHSTVTNNSRITIPSGLDGYYRILGHVVWTANSNTGWRMAPILKNGSVLNPPLKLEETVTSAFAHEQYTRDGLSLVAGDYIELAGNMEADPTDPLAVTAADLFVWKVG